MPQIGFGDPDSPGAPPTITLARILTKGAGRAGGSIVIETGVDYFERILDTADLGATGSIALMRHDGLLLARRPATPQLTGRSVSDSPLFQAYLRLGPSGVLDGPSPVDGSARLYGYATVDDYPLVIVVGRDKADALAFWFGWLWVAVVCWGLLSCTLMLLALRIGRESSRQAALIERLTLSEGRLQHSYGYLMRIVDTLATPLWVLDAQRRIVLFNDAFGRFTGRDAASIHGRPEAEVFDPAGAPARARLYARVKDKHVRALESEVCDGAGEVRTVIQLAACLESEDHSAQVVNSLTDITERKQAELRLAYLSDYDPVTGPAEPEPVAPRAGRVDPGGGGARRRPGAAAGHARTAARSAGPARL